MSNNTTVCPHCGKALNKLEEVHAVEGQLFCGRVCAVSYKTELNKANAECAAAEWYDEYAEIVATQDIGIQKTLKSLLNDIRVQVIIMKYEFERMNSNEYDLDRFTSAQLAIQELLFDEIDFMCSEAEEYEQSK